MLDRDDPAVVEILAHATVARIATVSRTGPEPAPMVVTSTEKNRP